MNIKPITDEVVYTSIAEVDGKIIIQATSSRKDKVCPFCGTVQNSPHTKFHRYLQDLPHNGKATYIEFDNKIMKCKNPECEHKTYSEEFSFAPMKAKYTNRLIEHIYEVAKTTTNRNAVELLKKEGIVVGKSVISKIMIKMGQDE